MRHAQHIAVKVIAVPAAAISLDGCTCGRAGKPIAVFVRLQQAGFLVSVGARPAAVHWIAAAMNHLLEIANTVIGIVLKIAPHSVAITR